MEKNGEEIVRNEKKEKTCGQMEKKIRNKMKIQHFHVHCANVEHSIDSNKLLELITSLNHTNYEIS